RMRGGVKRLVGVVLLVAATMGGATEPAPGPPEPSWRGSVLPDQWRRDFPRSPALDVPSPITHDEEVQRVTLKEAIAIGLENNPGIAARRLEPARFDTNVLQPQSEFDPTLGSELNYSRSVTPNPSSLSSAPTNVIEDRYANAHLYKLFRSGTQLNLDFLN